MICKSCGIHVDTEGLGPTDLVIEWGMCGSCIRGEIFIAHEILNSMEISSSESRDLENKEWFEYAMGYTE